MCYALFAHVNVLKRKTFYTAFCFSSPSSSSSYYYYFILFFWFFFCSFKKLEITNELCKCFVACFMCEGFSSVLPSYYKRQKKTISLPSVAFHMSQSFIFEIEQPNEQMNWFAKWNQSEENILSIYWERVVLFPAYCPVLKNSQLLFIFSCFAHFSRFNP